MLDKDTLIYKTASVKDALKRIDRILEKVLLVVDNKNRLLGTITDGDIRRYILRGKSLDNHITEIYNKKPHYLRKEDFSMERVKKMLSKNEIEVIPILDEEDKIVDSTTWNEAFSGSKISILAKSNIDIPVVIMAGGKGERLEPFSKILPKSLIPIGEKPITEIIIDEFRKQGASKFYLILNHKGGMVESYFNSLEKDCQISYIWENNFLGTAGGLKFLEKHIEDTFIVSNCDIIVKANFEEVVNFHKEQNAALTILCAIRHYKIPYGIIKFKPGGDVIDIHEKPEYTFPVNTGIHILSKDALQFIPKESSFDMPDLIKNLIENNKKVATYPVNENDYIDIGQWEEYKKAVKKLQISE